MSRPKGDISDATADLCKGIINELLSGEKTVRYIKKKFGMSDGKYVGIITVLTYQSSIYEYPVGKNKVMLGLLRR